MIGKSPHIMLCPQMCRILRLLGSGADAHASKTHFTVWKYQDFDIQIYVKLILEDVEISTVVFAIFGDLNVGVLINSSIQSAKIHTNENHGEMYGKLW